MNSVKMNLRALTMVAMLAVTISSIFMYSVTNKDTNHDLLSGASLFKDQVGGFVKEKGCSMATFYLEDLQN